MDCPYCAHNDTKVLESRLVSEGVRRRRSCGKCENRFTTYEKAFFNLTVLKKDGRMQPFDTKKISESLQRSCIKVDDTKLIEITNLIERKLLAKKINPIKTKEIGKVVLRELKKIDKMAYLRFASIHKSIEDPKLLEKELQTIT
ncbi:transcriptional repressor NrdR [Candidatus Woesearchaeota archaeon]|jgi:transcriptional repressor NrdR|nr:transcriptional repressor NrdR [Candidatus Woesearchaeota archaeon]MBT5740087.1 transcriptional repressor NrdR [Candidatus Woesearchaeota archaeon]